MYELVTIKNTQVPIFYIFFFLGLHFYLDWADFGFVCRTLGHIRIEINHGSENVF
jgi:hypothetical protein